MEERAKAAATEAATQLGYSILNSMLIIIQCKVHYNVHSTLYYRRYWDIYVPWTYKGLRVADAVVMGVVSGKDVFWVFPTGYDKSLCYGCLPLLFDKLLWPSKPSIVSVVTPLKAIIVDKVSLNMQEKLCLFFFQLLYWDNSPNLPYTVHVLVAL